MLRGRRVGFAYWSAIWGWVGWAVGGCRVGLGFDHGLRFGVEARVLTMGWVGLGFDHGLRWGR